MPIDSLVTEEILARICSRSGVFTFMIRIVRGPIRVARFLVRQFQFSNGY
jgi:hypothetical protein